MIYLKFNAAVSSTQKHEASYWMNEFCLRKGEGYFNTGKTEKILKKEEDKNFISTSEMAAAEFNEQQYLP